MKEDYGKLRRRRDLKVDRLNSRKKIQNSQEDGKVSRDSSRGSTVQVGQGKRELEVLA